MWIWDDGVSEAMVDALMAHWKSVAKGKGLHLVSDDVRKITAWEEKTKGSRGGK